MKKAFIFLFGLVLFACSSEDTEKKEKAVEKNNFVLEHQRESNRHCEEIAKLGKKSNCL